MLLEENSYLCRVKGELVGSKGKVGWFSDVYVKREPQLEIPRDVKVRSAFRRKCFAFIDVYRSVSLEHHLTARN